MKVELRPEFKMVYPKALFVILNATDMPNTNKHEASEERKRLFEREIKEIYAKVYEDSMLQDYHTYFMRWRKTYSIEFQIKTKKRGRKFPRISALVDSMFLAELKNRIPTSGHDLDAIEGNLFFDVSDECELYVKPKGKKPGLKKNDVTLRDEEGDPAFVLYSLARRASIKPKKRSPPYFAWCALARARSINYDLFSR